MCIIEPTRRSSAASRFPHAGSVSVMTLPAIIIPHPISIVSSILWIGCLSFLATALALRLSTEGASVRSAAPPRPTWAPYKEWDFDTSANMSMADEAEWKRLAVKDDESINANPQLKWDELSYPVGLKATPHPKVGGSSHLDEKIDKMMPSLQPLPFAFDEMLSSCLFLTLLAPTSCLVSVAPDKVVRDPLPLPTSTGVTQKKPMAPTIDGVRVDLGKPVDYGALIGPSRTVPAGPPSPPSVFEKPDLSWSPRLNTTIATYSITAAVPVRSRGLEGWLPKRGSLTRLQEETPSTFTSTTAEEDISTERKLKKIIADHDD
ncbi:hypothetical protein FOZ62_027581 [Perkinsus olseni]|uniref:Uncharacterized protein n=1 Tax=Perkinsus olseni TaxID=32597 RepID=A0A7J6S3Q2_PEROL|nr:hypothetical protein FOZ62_027581 [Perkinsus olseni]